MEQKKKPFNKGGRKPKLDPRTHRYSLNLDDVEKQGRLLHPTLPIVFTIQEHRHTV